MTRRSPSAAAPLAARGRRTFAASSLACVAALTLAGCQWTSTIQTDQGYEPADGTSTTMGNVLVNNVLLVAAQEGGPGTLVGLGVNRTAQPVEVSFQVQDGAPIPLTIPAQSSARLSAPGEDMTTVPAVAVAPGGLVDVTVTTAGEEARTIRVPVIAPQGHYEPYAPGGAAATTTATATETTTASPTTPPAAPTQTDAPAGTTTPAN